MNITKYTINGSIIAKLLNCAQRKVKKASIIIICGRTPQNVKSATKAFKKLEICRKAKMADSVF